MTNFTNIYKDGLKEETKKKPVGKLSEGKTKMQEKKESSLTPIKAPPAPKPESVSFEQIHIIREQIRREMTEEVVNKLKESVKNDVEKELTKSLTESIKKEIETQSANANLKLAEAIEALTNKIAELNESLNIEIPAPVVNAIIPRTVKKINRDKNGLIESIEEVEQD